jgi:hypothetical protein
MFLSQGSIYGLLCREEKGRYAAEIAQERGIRDRANEKEMSEM